MGGLCPGSLSESSRFDSDLQLAMELSAKELAEQELRLQEEEAELQQVLQLSLTEKLTLLPRAEALGRTECCVTETLGQRPALPADSSCPFLM